MRGMVHDGGGQRVVRHHVRDGAGALVLCIGGKRSDRIVRFLNLATDVCLSEMAARIFTLLCLYT